jgi:hypothetical protein
MTEHARRIQKIDAEIKRLQTRIKELRVERDKSAAMVLKAMDRTGVDTIEGIKRARVTPKKRAPLKPKKARERDALAVLSQIGVPNPERAWASLRATQTARQRTET